MELNVGNVILLIILSPIILYFGFAVICLALFVLRLLMTPWLAIIDYIFKTKYIHKLYASTDTCHKRELFSSGMYKDSVMDEGNTIIKVGLSLVKNTDKKE